MSVWRPASSIQIKALGLVWRDTCFLASKVLDDSGKTKGIRPLGGTIEFGETWQNALSREFYEELGSTIKILGDVTVFENIYTHHESTGHEVIFICDIELTDKRILQQETIYFTEHDGSNCTASWYSLNEIQKNGPELYPKGLLDVMLRMSL